MTPKQLQRFLDEHGLSQRGAAREIGIGERTMRSYIAGDLPVPRTVEYALRWVASQPRSKDQGRRVK
jgi:DNA transposition AAA+ family ATPase